MFKGSPAVVSTPTNVASPKLKTDTGSNQFFGVRPPKRSSVTHIKDDFNPFKNGKSVEAGQVGSFLLSAMNSVVAC